MAVIESLSAGARELPGLLADFLDALDAGVVIYTPTDDGADFTFTYLNRIACQLAQVTQDGAIGRRLSELMRGARAMGLSDALARVSTSGVPETLPSRTYDDDLRHGVLTNDLYPLHGGHVAVVFRDVGEKAALRHALSAERSRYRLLTSALPGGVWDYDLTTDSLFLSPSFKTQLGYREDELGDSFATFEQLLAAEDRGRVLSHLVEFKERGAERWEQKYYLRHKDGHLVPVISQGTAVRDGSGRLLRLLGIHFDLSDRQALEDVRARQSALLDSLLGVLPDLFLLLDREGRIVDLQTRYTDGLIVRREMALGHRAGNFLPDSLAAEFREVLEHTLSSGESRCFPYTLELNGETRHYEAYLAATRDGDSIACMVHDETQHVRDRQELDRRAEARDIYRQVVTSSQDQLAAVDHEKCYLMVNEAYAQFFGRTPEGLRGCRLDDVIVGDALYRNVAPGLARCLRGEAVSFQEWRTATDGEQRYFNVTYTPLGDTTRPRGALISAHDITALQQVQAKLENLANHDQLTGLPNRVLLATLLSRSMSQAKRHRLSLALLFIDLDHFKEVNDSLGHAAGDAVLVEAASRLQSNLRDSDALARVGGDEFVAVLDEVGERDDLLALAGKLMGSITEPFLIEGHRACLSCSIGISLYPQDGNTADALIAHADAAMYEAKTAGRNACRFYSAATEGHEGEG